MCKKEKEAYMTVEASLIFPTIMGGIIFILYLGFYLYNVSTMKQTAYIAALRGSCLINASTDEIEIYVKEQSDKLVMNQILAKGNVGQEVKVSPSKVKVWIDLDMKMPFAGFISSEIGLWTMECEAEANRVNPVDIIRSVRKINESQISK